MSKMFQESDRNGNGSKSRCAIIFATSSTVNKTVKARSKSSNLFIMAGSADMSSNSTMLATKLAIMMTHLLIVCMEVMTAPGIIGLEWLHVHRDSDLLAMDSCTVIGCLNLLHPHISTLSVFKSTLH